MKVPPPRSLALDVAGGPGDREEFLRSEVEPGTPRSAHLPDQRREDAPPRSRALDVEGGPGDREEVLGGEVEAPVDLLVLHAHLRSTAFEIRVGCRFQMYSLKMLICVQWRSRSDLFQREFQLCAGSVIET